MKPHIGSEVNCSMQEFSLPRNWPIPFRPPLINNSPSLVYFRKQLFEIDFFFVKRVKEKGMWSVIRAPLAKCSHSARRRPFISFEMESRSAQEDCQEGDDRNNKGND